MDFLRIILHIFIFYSIYLLGGYIQQLVGLSIPGSIIGMLLLFASLQLKLVKRKWFSLGSSFLLKHLPVFFLPATVGVMEYLPLFKGWGLMSIFVTLISTIIVMYSSAKISDLLLARSNRVDRDHQKEISL
ncbi:CidA/LrgA family protein [Bacillus weihaiensis]|uniref:CidA/LrgA family protein n=1 Tax=Bacillus weihaiensis TaxID=1547283 RepID=UPI001F3E867A|nr:CidA/LrgA family protein [Bacillus weihaiensis]